jgi:uncharacterized repeat protein (TIGR03803 family)
MNALRLAKVICIVLALLTAISSTAQTVATLFTFDGTDGSNPLTPLIQGNDGKFYGTTNQGGTTPDSRLGGTVFAITPTGKLTTLYNFYADYNPFNGQNPNGPLVQGPDRNFYGTAYGGGLHNAGTVFKISKDGELTTLYSFCHSHPICPDGARPTSGLVQGLNGNFYGLTVAGGANGEGTIFQITPGGKFTSLYSFCSLPNCADGSFPYQSGLVVGANGNIYGTTYQGGVCPVSSSGCGTIFQITPAGELTTVYNFCHLADCADGATPVHGLVLGADGNLYGVTALGGLPSSICTIGCGTLFKITPGGKLTTLYSFCSQGNCYYYTLSPVQASDGNFYAVSPAGPPGSYGEIVKFTRRGVISTLYSFESSVGSLESLMQATNGGFYGTALVGSDGDGAIFSISIGPAPFVETQTVVGTVGSLVNILGNDLKGATAVTFNGTPAAFKVVSGAEITATIPARATTGPVRVTTSSGTLSSNIPFHVIP